MNEFDYEPRVAKEPSFAPCPNCGETMFAVFGSFNARCKNCGFKDACCF